MSKPQTPPDLLRVKITILTEQIQAMEKLVAEIGRAYSNAGSRLKSLKHQRNTAKMQAHNAGV